MHSENKGIICVNNQINTTPPPTPPPPPPPAPSIMHFLLNSKDFLTVLISSNKHFSYAIKINLEIRHTACCKLYITKHDCTAGHTFKRYDDHIAWLRHIIINELQIPKLSEYIRIDHQLYMKFVFTGSPVPLLQWFRYGYIC